MGWSWEPFLRRMPTTAARGWNSRSSNAWRRRCARGRKRIRATRTMTPTPFSLLALGFVLGLHHAFDVDHLVAVLAIVSERRGLRRSSLVGIAWGVGHTTSLFAVALATIALHAQIPPWASQVFELAVALLLCLLV